jgi:hypothetical protein
MSTGIGTLQAPRRNRSIWPAAVIASLLMLSIGIGAFFLARDEATPPPKSAVSETEQIVGGTAANTPTELSGGVVGAAPPTFVDGLAGTAGNTPSELSGGYVPDVFDRSHQRH